MLDLTHIKKVIGNLDGVELSQEGRDNLVCWLGERTHLLVAEIERLRGSNARLVSACVAARQFISNGVETGYIRMPEPGDSALDTPTLLDAVLAEARAEILRRR